MKSERYVLVQRRKSVKYGEKKNYQDYVTIPADISRSLGLLPRQVMRCVVNGRGVLTYVKAELESEIRMTYGDWINAIRGVIPLVGEQGKTYSHIRREANIRLKSAPALWVKQAERDIGLIRKRDPNTHRLLWTKLSATQNLPRKFKDLTLTELAEDNTT